MEKTISEAAPVLGKSVATLRDMCRRKKLKARRVGRNWLIDMTGLVPGGRRRKGAAPPPPECPRQRAVTLSVGAIVDIFSSGFAPLDREERLSAFAPAEDEPARWRNAVRMCALGMVVRLGRDLGLATNDLHGDERLRGKTRIPELKKIQRTTALNAMRMCDAMLEDRGDMPTVARERYTSIRAKARLEVSKARASNRCTCGPCTEERERWSVAGAPSSTFGVERRLRERE